MHKDNCKKKRLLKAADELFLQKGTDLTTLADIASLAEVPLGNVYYYFKTKNEIVSDVIKIRFKEIQELLTKIDGENQSPALQLKAFMQNFVNLDNVVPQNFGFMLTILWVELGKAGGSLLQEFLPLPEYILNWCQNKFQALARGEQASHYANNLLSSLYGLCVNRHSQAAKELIPSQINFLTQTMGLAG